MRHLRFALAASLAALAAPAAADVARPVALTADAMPAVPDALAAATRPYMEYRTAIFTGWNAADRSMLVATRFANTNQLHTVARPLGMRRQISFEPEPVSGEWSAKGDVLAVVKDNGGDEFFQIYTLANGRLVRLTDGKSRNNFGAWDKEGRRIGEIRSPLYVVQGANDPRVPKSEADQIVKAVRANGNDVWYLLADNEGHGYAKKENLDYLFWTTLMFWQKNLLGR